MLVTFDTPKLTSAGFDGCSCAPCYAYEVAEMHTNNA